MNLEGMPTVLEVYNYESTATIMPKEFLICDYCYWAASSIGSRLRDVVTCPQCDALVSRIPLTLGESVSFSIDARRGVELSFAGR